MPPCLDDAETGCWLIKPLWILFQVGIKWVCHNLKLIDYSSLTDIWRTVRKLFITDAVKMDQIADNRSSFTAVGDEFKLLVFEGDPA